MVRATGALKASSKSGEFSLEMMPVEQHRIGSIALSVQIDLGVKAFAT